ncbi:MAG: hypothetical protein V1915_02015 [Candidatus Bathyarchaeota archaeon]
MPTEEEIKIDKFDKPINVLVIDEPPEDWRLWNAFARFLSRPNDLALKVYVVLLEKDRQMSTRDLAGAANVSLYNAQRALKDLYDLGLVSREIRRRGYLNTEYWTIKTQISGVLRIIPENYFKEGQPNH